MDRSKGVGQSGVRGQTTAHGGDRPGVGPAQTRPPPMVECRALDALMNVVLVVVSKVSDSVIICRTILQAEFILLWNELPDCLRLIDSLELFKSNLKTRIFKAAFVNYL